MRAVVMHAPGDVRVEEIEAPVIVEPTDAIIRVTATCVCGSDLWPYRGIEKLNGPTPMGHEYVGVVEQVGPDVNDIEVGDFVVGSFVASDNTCEICEAGFQSRCIHQVMMGSVGTQSEYARIPLADGTLVPVRGEPTERQARSLLAASDVLGTGWFAAVSAEAGPGKTVARRRRRRSRTSGDPRCQTTRRRADHRHVHATPTGQALATQFGATDIVEERGSTRAFAKIKELTGGYGAHSTVEAVGTQESMMQAIGATRPGGHVGYVGVSHGVELDGMNLFFATVSLLGGPRAGQAIPTRTDRAHHDRPDRPRHRLRPHSPVGRNAAAGYRAMDERRATKVLLTL